MEATEAIGNWLKGMRNYCYDAERTKCCGG